MPTQPLAECELYPSFLRRSFRLRVEPERLGESAFGLLWRKQRPEIGNPA
jgi:hypothetical protein